MKSSAQQTTIPSHLLPAFVGICVLLFTIVVQLRSPTATNVSWLLVVGNRMLAGDRLYTDIVEMNPPASVLLYLPEVWIGRTFGLKAEHVLLVFVLLCLLAALAFSYRILARSNIKLDPLIAAVSALIAFGLVAGNAFAEREHFAVILMLPMLSVIACRSQLDARVLSVEAIVAGAAAGLAVAMKPHFAAAIFFPELFVLWQTRNLSLLLRVENWILLSVFLLYLLGTIVFFHDYWSTVFPVVTDAYIPARLPLPIVLAVILPFVIPTGCYCYLAKIHIVSAKHAIPLGAALGFFLAYAVQSKAWPYHFYPAVALCLFVVLNDCLEALVFAHSGANKITGIGARSVTAAVLTIVAIFYFLPPRQVSQSLEATIRKISDHPRILAISGDLAIGHPLTRDVDGIWVGTVASQWMAENVYNIQVLRPYLYARRSESLAKWIKKDRSILAADIRKGKPDVILIDTRGNFWKAWAQADQELAALLSSYVFITKNDFVELHVRRDVAENRP
jgi:hypothetical protein